MGDDGGGYDGGGGDSSSYSTNDYSNSYSGGHTEESHFSSSFGGGASNDTPHLSSSFGGGASNDTPHSFGGGSHDTVDYYNRNVSTDIDPPGLPENKGHTTNDQPVITGSGDDSGEDKDKDKDWPGAEPSSPTVEEPLLDEDDIITEYSPESKEKMNGDGLGLLNPMFSPEDSSFGNEGSPNDNGCTTDDCCYYTVVCCDCTIL